MVPREGGFKFGCLLFTRAARLQLVPVGTCFILCLTGEKLNLARRQLRLASCSLCNARGTRVNAVTSGIPTLPLQNYGGLYHLARSCLNQLSAAIYYPFIIYSFDFVHDIQMYMYYLNIDWFMFAYICSSPSAVFQLYHGECLIIESFIKYIIRNLKTLARHIFSLRGDVCAHWTGFFPPLFIGMPVQNQEGERSCKCVFGYPPCLCFYAFDNWLRNFSNYIL